jgi:hypothetical protein
LDEIRRGNNLATTIDLSEKEFLRGRARSPDAYHEMS